MLKTDRALIPSMKKMSELERLLGISGEKFECSGNPQSFFPTSPTFPTPPKILGLRPARVFAWH